MSHGTGSGYAVVSQVELNRRCVEAARLRCLSLVARLGVVSPTAPQPEPPSSISVTAWEHYEANLRDQVERAFGDIEAAAFRTQVADVTAVVPTWLPDPEWQDDAAVLPDGAAEERVRASIGRALELVARIQDPAHRRRLATLAERALRILDEDRSTARGHLNVIRAEAQASLRLQAARTLLGKRVEAARHDYADVLGQRAEALRADLDHVVDQRDLDTIEAELTEIRAIAEAEADRRFVVEQAAAALREMGYQIGEEFVPSVLERRTVVSTPDLPGYGVELDFQKKRRRLVTEVVSFTADRRGDVAAEEAVCEHLDALAERLGDAVTLTREQTIEPGEVEVVRVTATESARIAETERGAAR